MNETKTNDSVKSTPWWEEFAKNVRERRRDVGDSSKKTLHTCYKIVKISFKEKESLVSENT